MSNNSINTDLSYQVDDKRYPRPLWIRIPRWIPNHIFRWVVEDIIAEMYWLAGPAFYLLGTIYNLAALVVVYNHNNFGVLWRGSNIIQALPFSQFIPLLIPYWWVVLLVLVGLIVGIMGLSLFWNWAEQDEKNEAKELQRRKEKFSSINHNDLRYPRTIWVRILRWIGLNWGLVPTIYILTAIVFLCLLVIHSGFIALLIFNDITHALLFDAFGQNTWVVIIVTLIVVKGLWHWAYNDETNEDDELKLRKLESQERQLPAGLKLRYIFRWQKGDIRQIAWSPDGRTIASGSQHGYRVPGGHIRLWDSENGALLRELGSSRTDSVGYLAWSPDGRAIATESLYGYIRLWDSENGALLRELESSYRYSYNKTGDLAWSPDGSILASIQARPVTIQLWDTKGGQMLQTFKNESSNYSPYSYSPDSYSTKYPTYSPVMYSCHGSLVLSPDGLILASAVSDSSTIELWDTKSGQVRQTLEGSDAYIEGLAWSPNGQVLASASGKTILLWDPETGRQLGSLEGHTGKVFCVAFSCDGRLLASKSADHTVRLWRSDTWETLAILKESVHSYAYDDLSYIYDNAAGNSSAGLAFHPKMGSVLATLGTGGRVIRVWDLDLMTLLDSSQMTPLDSIDRPYDTITLVPVYNSADYNEVDQKTEPMAKIPNDPVISLRSAITKGLPSRPTARPATPTTVRYTNAKVILVGDSGVGKSGLGLVLTGQPFAPTESTHGRFVWTFDSQEVELGVGQKEIRETLLWDLAGQPGYRLIHQLHLNEVTVALVIVDARSETDPFAGVYHWDRALRQAQRVQGNSALPMKKFLVAARMDRGGTGVSAKRVRSLVDELGFDGFFETSAKEGWNISILAAAVRSTIDWTALPWVSSTELFQRIKAFLVAEKEAGRLLSSVDDLYHTFLKSDPSLAKIEKLDAQFNTCIGRVEARGLIRCLSFGNLVLLQPEMLDAYASALVNAVRDEPDGLGSITEAQARAGNFPLPQEQRLKNKRQEQLLLIAMVEDLLHYEIALREQADDGPHLVFPSQSTRENPDLPNPEGKAVVFSFEGPVLNLYATLAVRLSHSGLFQKQELWKNAVAYTTKLGGTYGIFLHNSGEGLAELTLFFDKAAREEICFHFEEYISAHLQRHALPDSVQRKRIFVCPLCSTRLDGAQVASRRQRGFNWMTCGVCDTKVSLLDREERLAAQPSQVQQMDAAANTERDRAIAQTILQGKIATGDFDVFLCHNGKDKPAVKKLGEQLKELGILPWLDEWELRPGLPWQSALEKQIDNIKSAAVFVGKDGIGPWQHMELDAFLRTFVSRGCPVIPILLVGASQKPKLPPFLSNMTWVDFRVQDPDPMQQLIWGITGDRYYGGVRRW